jgi:hypothetical protein
MGKASRRKRLSRSSSLYHAKKPPIPDRIPTGTVSKILPQTITLKSYIETLLSVEVSSCNSKPCNCNSASTNYCVHVPSEVLQLLQTTKILPDPAAKPNAMSIPPPDEPRAPMKEILLRFIDYQIKGCKDYKIQNCLTLGYRFKSMNSVSTLRNHENLECFYVNTLHSYFGNAQWQVIAKTFGELLVRHVLSRPLFIAAPRNCYLQLAGMPVPEVIRRTPNTVSNAKNTDRSSSQVATEATTNHSALNSIKPGLLGSNIVSNHVEDNKDIVRFTIFYNTKYQKRIGLPQRHILNKVS